MTDPNDPSPGNHSAGLQRLDILLLGLLLVLTFFVGSFAATNSDVWMHLAAGRQIAQGEWTIGVDPFSFATEATATRPAIPWVQHSWLYSLVLYWLYNLLGGSGLVVLKALSIVALAWCLLQIPGDRRFRLLAVIYVGLAMLASSREFILRPQTLSFLFFGITLLWCQRAGVLGGEFSRPRILWRLPLLFLLWANVDAWFIMGPLTLALLWLGMGLGRLLGLRGNFPGKTLGAVLAIGLLACLVNPHHIRVFMVPPELALAITQIYELPDFLGAGGRAMRGLQLVDPNFYSQVSPFATRYFMHPLTPSGPNIAGICYYPLLLLGAVSFVVNAMVTTKPGAPGLQPARFVLWCFLALLSMIHIRFIPWFALASAPLTVLNLVDWRAWRMRKPAAASEGSSPPATSAPPENLPPMSRRPAYLGRLLALIVILVLLFLAWPGWLHTSLDNFAGGRRVTWDVPADPSLRAAALRLAELKPADKDLHVFNFSPDMAHYCAWYAPGVKGFADLRWALFPEDAARAERARRGLATNEPEAWQQLFADRHVDYLALTSAATRRDTELAPRLWLNEKHWKQEYGDGQTLVFAWSGPARTFRGGELLAELDRLAFGKVPDSQRPPPRAPAWPQEEPSSWSLYGEGTPPFPLMASEAVLWLQYHQVMASTWRSPHFVVSMVARGAEPAGLGFKSITLPYALGTMENIPAVINMPRSPRSNKPALKSRDFGPPAAAILLMRRARQALAEGPNNPRVYLVLGDACSYLAAEQEDYWTNYNTDPRLAVGLRVTLRKIQVMTAMRTFLELQPDNPQIHEQVATRLLQFNFLDAALEHLQQATRYFDLYVQAVRDARTRDGLKKQLEELTKKTEQIEEEVKKRRESYLLEAATKPGLSKYTLAMNRGLAKEAVNVLLELKPQELNPHEREARDYALTRLLLLMGRAPALSEGIGKTGPEFAEFRAYHAAALGNYADVDKALAENEAATSAMRSRWLSLTAVDIFGFGVGTPDPMPLLGRMSLGAVVFQRTLENLARPLAETRTVRGLMLLEHGDTTKARQQFEAALDVAGPLVYFQDRPIAERYLELLRAAQPVLEPK